MHAVEPDASWNSPAVHAVHVDWRRIAVNVPGEHGELVREPVAHDEPSGQSVQSDAAASPALLEYVPARQGSCADAPRGQKLPLSQVTHAVDPLETWKLPAVHAVHSDWRVIAVKVPGAHGELVVEPVAQDDPVGHAAQSDAAARPVLLEKVPARHGSSADAP